MVRRMVLIAGTIIAAYIFGVWYGTQATYVRMVSEAIEREIERATKGAAS